MSKFILTGGMSGNDSSKKLSIIGGGITGLTAAYEAMERGERDIHVYEASGRFGGKIQSGVIGNTIINRGAEFIDSDQPHIIALARSLGIGLVENTGMQREEFQRPDGSMMDSDKFYQSYKPYAEQVMRDRLERQQNPGGARAQHLNSLSLEDYLAELAGNVPIPTRSLWRALVDTLTLRGNEAGTTLAIASRAFASECGQPTRNISAAQFIAETSATADCFLTSDCKFRVEGGTEHLLVKMREKMAAGGVHFHTGAELKSIQKQTDGKLGLTFNDPQFSGTTDRVILGLPTYAQANVEGLGALGLSGPSQSLIRENQYTKNIKLTIAFKPGMATKDAAFFSNQNFQCWSPAPGLLTFLANADNLGEQPAKEFITQRLETYAKAHGSTAAKMFDLNFPKGSLDFNNPGAKACYATPKPGQADALEALKSELPALAKNGVGIAGTYLPNNGTLGFMECGVVSAKQSVDLLVGPGRSLDQSPTPQLAKWQDYVATRQVAANDVQQPVVANAR